MHLMDIDASQRDFHGPREATSAYLGVIEFKILTVVPGLLHGLDDDFQCLFTGGKSGVGGGEIRAG